MGLADGVAWERDYGAPERRTVAGQQSEPEWIKGCTAKISNAIGGGSEFFVRIGDGFRLDVDFACRRISEMREHHHTAMQRAIKAERQAEALQRAVREMQDRYENWMPVGAPPSPYANPNALIHFQCFSEADDDCENPEYFVTTTWDERPADAVRWCAINSPIFISRALLGGSEHA